MTWLQFLAGSNFVLFWHLAVGHPNSCAVGTRDNAARPFYWSSIIIYCWYVNCLGFALCDFTTWHFGTEKTLTFILLVQVLRPVCWFTIDSVEFFCYAPHQESLGGSSIILSSNSYGVKAPGSWATPVTLLLRLRLHGVFLYSAAPVCTILLNPEMSVHFTCMYVSNRTWR